MADGWLGTEFAGYRIDAVIAQGGMGVVYKATDSSLDRTVALKMITPTLADDPQFRERFIDESKVAASLDHPNVIPIYQAGDWQGTLFLVMRFVPGDDLGTLIDQEGGLAPPRAARIAAQVASALDTAHEGGLVHRDIKPANVLIAGNDHAYLTDFGLTKRLASGTAHTQTGQLLGTLDYVAPEQIRGQPTSPATDVYALGCLLFHSLTGRVPYPLPDNEAKLWAHLSEEPPRASGLTPGVPPALDDVLATAMNKRPEERFSTAGELGAAALEAAEAHAPAEQVGKPRLRPSVAAATGRGRATVAHALSEPLGVIAVAAILVAGAFLGGLAIAIPIAVAVYAIAVALSYRHAKARGDHGTGTPPSYPDTRAAPGVLVASPTKAPARELNGEAPRRPDPHV